MYYKYIHCSVLQIQYNQVILIRGLINIMNDVKVASFRINDDDISKFRELAEEQGLNQAEMFQGLLNAYSMSKAKLHIADRSKEIEVFQNTINNLVSMFINSLAINQTSEERIKEMFSLELTSKDNIIIELQAQRDKLKEEAKKMLADTLDKDGQIDSITNELDKNSSDLKEKTEIIHSQQQQISTLNSIICEYKELKDLNTILEEENNKLSKDNSILNNTVTDIKLKLENTENMKAFYKNEVDNLKLEITNLNDLIANKERKQAEELERNKEILEEKYSNELKSHIEIEKDKMLVQIERITNKYENVKDKYENSEEQLKEYKARCESLEAQLKAPSKKSK
jgi:chromosome segregation ATPase